MTSNLIVYSLRVLGAISLHAVHTRRVDTLEAITSSLSFISETACVVNIGPGYSLCIPIEQIFPTGFAYHYPSPWFDSVLSTCFLTGFPRAI